MSRPILSPSHSACLPHARKILYHRSLSPDINTYITKFCNHPGYLENLWLQWWEPCNGFLSGQYFAHEAGFSSVPAITPKSRLLFSLLHFIYHIFHDTPATTYVQMIACLSYHVNVKEEEANQRQICPSILACPCLLLYGISILSEIF